MADGLGLLIDDDETWGRVDVRHIDRLAHAVVSQRHGRLKILRDAEQRDIWRHIVQRMELPFTESFLFQEWRQVILAQNITSADDHLAAKRAGRGRRLGAQQKAQLWQAVCNFTDDMGERSASAHDAVCVEATRLLEETTDKPYRHVILDGAQDLHPVRWRLLRAAAPARDDDIFIAGDTHQRIYDNRVSLRTVGIQVTGRSTRLTINYRTTAEILGWSLGMLAGERIDDMDEGLETLAGCRSDVHGMPPELHGVATKPAEFDHLAAKVRTWLDVGVAPAEIGGTACATTCS